MNLRTTHTFALLEVSEQTYLEIEGKLREAGYDHAFQETENDGHNVIAIDMHGIAIVKSGR